MYKMVTICSNCGTEFEELEKFNEETAFDYVRMCESWWGITFGEHECTGGEIGMKVFKCFREVKE